MGFIYDFTKEKVVKTLEMLDSDWSIAEDLVNILKPLQKATQTIIGEYYPTLGNVYPINASLISSHLNDDNDELHGSVKKCRKLIQESLKRHFKISKYFYFDNPWI